MSSKNVGPLLFVLFAVLVGCGGGSSKLSNADLSKLSGVESTVTGFCVSGGQGSGAQLGDLNGAVSTLIDEYKAHKTATVQLVPNAPKMPFKQFARMVENQLGCAPEQANRIEQAIGP